MGESTKRKVAGGVFGLLVLAGGVLVLRWSFGAAQPRADFVYINGSEPETLDPHVATGVPEHRIFLAIHEGLTERHPKTLEPLPAVAESWDISEDGKTYTFHIRKGLTWSNGDPLTAYDMMYSWERVLRPETASEYSYMLWYVVNAENYSGDKLRVLTHEFKPDASDPRLAWRTPCEITRIQPVGESLFVVERRCADGSVESGMYDARVLDDSGLTANFLPSGTVVVTLETSEENKAKGLVTIGESGTNRVLGEVPEDWLKGRDIPEIPEGGRALEIPYKEYWKRNKELLSALGFSAPDESTFVVHLHSVTPFFLQLLAHYAAYPVHMETVDKWGEQWIMPEHIVTNGPFTLESWKLNQGIRCRKNPRYWDAEEVHLDTVEYIPSEYRTTSFNMFVTGVGDWTEQYPVEEIDRIQNEPWFQSAPYLGSYFYRFNVTKAPTDNKLVRQALNMATNKKELCEQVRKGGVLPSEGFVPTYMKDYGGYETVLGPAYNPEKARELLAEAGYPGGKGMPEVEILINTDEAHRKMAVRIQKQWETNLGIKVRILNQEWKVYLESQRKKEYQVCRAGWIGDYVDPNTFMDMWLTDGGNNKTGWSNKKYDALIAAAGRELDTRKRWEIFQEAEAILMDEMPILPIYQYRSFDLIHMDKWDGFYGNILQEHPPKWIRRKGA